MLRNVHRRHDFPAILQKQLKRPALKRRKIHRPAIQCCCHGRFVQAYIAAGERPRWFGRGPAQYGAQANQQLLSAEGFRQIIVGPRVKPVYTLHPAAARCQDNDRNIIPFLAPTSQNGHSVQSGEAKVKNDRVKFAVTAFLPNFETIRNMLHLVARRLKRIHQMLRYGWIVFGKKDAHQEPRKPKRPRISPVFASITTFRTLPSLDLTLNQ